MKITKSLASNNIKIPEPFDAFYEILPSKEYENEFGIPAYPTPCEECEGYEIEHIAYLIAQPEFFDELQDAALDVVELIKEGSSTFLAYVVGDRIYPVEKADMPDITTFEEYEEAGYLDDDEEEIESATCIKVNEDDDMIEYVIK